ncbi:MAG: hypothetical protein NTW38_06470 [Candidatus Aminicenantes bacterium]|nr:hypothetical protein [Candidatus Aminicenantes bacterium]
MKPKGVEIAVLGAVLLMFACQSKPAGASASPAPQDVSVPVEKAEPPVDPVYNEIASFLAGRPCATSPYKEFQETEEYRAFAAALDKSWADLETKRLQLMRDWTGTELADAVAATTTLFYPFGGPDALTALVLFPKASRYLLLGLEFVGRMPEFDIGDAAKVSAYFQNLQASLTDFFNKSYFITKNMNEELAGDKVDGVLPLLCFFLKRSGNMISSVKRLEFTEKGEILESAYPGEPKKFRRPYGIRVSFFADGTDVLKEMSYISCDLADAAFRKEKPVTVYLSGLPFETTFVKSASYLMHYKEFSNIRNLILDRSRFVLEDDTGIPYKDFPPETWESRLYGEYIKPVADFSGVDQPDLKEAYTDPAKVKSLPFHLGYHWGTNKDSLLYFVKK